MKLHRKTPHEYNASSHLPESETLEVYFRPLALAVNVRADTKH
jgi:hypothetical protein